MDQGTIFKRFYAVFFCILLAAVSLARSESNMAAAEPPQDSKISLEYLGSFGGPVGHKVRHGNLGVASLGSCVEILDCSDPAHPKRLARCWMGGRVTGLDFAGKALYLAVKNRGIKILDISDPAKPKDQGDYEPYEMNNRLYYYELEVHNQVLLISGQYGKTYTSIEAVDIRDPWNPKKLASHGNSMAGSDEETEEDEKVYRLAGKAPAQAEEKIEYESPYKDFKEILPVSENVACTFMGGNLCTLDLSDPDNPKILGKLAIKSGEAIVREKTLIVSNEKGIHFISIGDPGKPSVISFIQDTGTIAVDWPRTLVVEKDKEFTTYDLADLRHPRASGHFTLPRSARDWKIANHRAYIACMDLRIYNLTDPAKPRLEGIVKCEDPEGAKLAKVYDGFRARDVELCGEYAYCETSCVDVSNPKIPKVISNDLFDPPWGIDVNVYIRASQVRVFGRWGIQSITSNDHDEENVGSKMNIYDLADPAHPELVYTLKGLDEDAIIAGGRLYLMSEMSGVIVLKLKSAAGTEQVTRARKREETPRFLDVMEKAQNRGDFAGLKQIKIAGELACGRQDERTLVTIDLNKPTQPRLIGRCELPEAFGTMAIDGNFCFAGGTDGALYTVDISKPAMPALCGTYKLDEAPRAMAASGGRLYVAAGKLKILDAGKPEKLSELGTYAPKIPSTDLTTSGTMVYLAARGMEIVDTVNPENPVCRYRFPSFPNPALRGKTYSYDYVQKGYVTQEIKRLGNVVYLIAVSAADVTRCKMLVFDVSNPSAPQGCGRDFEARGEDIDNNPEWANLRDSNPSKYAGWLLGLPIKTQAVDTDRAGLLFFEMFDPTRPSLIGSYEGLSDPRKAVLYKNLVYLADEKKGLVILKREQAPAK